MDYISDEKFNQLNGGKFKSGDILFCLRGSLGKFAVVRNDETAGAIASSLIIIRPNRNKTTSNYIEFYLESIICKNMIELLSGGAAQPNLGGSDLGLFKIPLPPTLTEQKAIAKVLSDTDALIQALEKKIDKKKLIKKGVMQELLKPKENWTIMKLGTISDIYTGKKNNQDKVENGRYPFFVRSQTIESINSYSFDGEAILVPGEGNIGKIFHYINGKFDFHQRVYKISGFKYGYSGKYIYRYISEYFGLHAMENSVKATVDSLRLPTFEEFEIPFPPTFEEQIHIAQILIDIDYEIESLDQKLEKYKLAKQGMMQQLLTGKIRLV